MSASSILEHLCAGQDAVTSEIAAAGLGEVRDEESPFRRVSDVMRFVKACPAA